MSLHALENDSVEQDSLLKLAENLQILLKEHNLNASQLGQILSMPMMTVRRLLSGETTDPRISTLKIIAEYFNISVDDLINGVVGAFPKPINPKPLFVPILDWETASKCRSDISQDLTTWKEWQPLPLAEGHTMGQNAFALESRPSMYPRFSHGSILIIDPDLTPIDGDIVLLKFKKDNELTLRELNIDLPEWQLNSLVFESNSLIFNKIEHEIVGVNVLTLLYNR